MEDKKPVEQKPSIEYENSCISCKFFKTDSDFLNCSFHGCTVKKDEPKCSAWRYFA